MLSVLHLADLFPGWQLAVEDLLEGLLGDLTLEPNLGRTDAAPEGRLGGVFGGVIVVLGEVARRT